MAHLSSADRLRRRRPQPRRGDGAPEGCRHRQPGALHSGPSAALLPAALRRARSAGRRALLRAHALAAALRSEEQTSELQSLMRISYAVFCLKKKNINNNTTKTPTIK